MFQEVNQNGVQGSYPKADSGWAGEIALDIEMASAGCPNCKILLVEVSSPTDANLGTGVNTAVNNPTAFFDVSSGSNGSCGESYLCTGKAGFDGPTGNGTPNDSVLGGGSGSGGGSSGGSSGTGGGGSSCAHSICASGTKLTSSCDPCAGQICAQDSYCCSTKWDSICVSEVASIC
jgi:hypothetical protein